jgi:DNA-binding NtrC family response regulator/tetratricopeptide (TPR) repeat protein
VIAGTNSILGRARAALERGRGAEAAKLLTPALRSGTLSRDDELAVRSALAEAWLLQDDLSQAATALGRPPDSIREPIDDAPLSMLWRLHGRVAFARGDKSRAIALHARALKHADLAHDSRAIGLARYELAHCYRQVGDSGIVREHLTQAAAALHAAGERRHLALVHSLSAVLLAQSGRCEEAEAALGQCERLAKAIQADDLLAGVAHNQANVALMRKHLDRALALAERSVSLHEALGSGHGLAVALASLGQILVQLGDLERAELVLTRTLEVRSPVQFQETTGAVYDSLAQIHMMRGSYERAGEYLRLASDGYGAYGTHSSRWYEWSLLVLGVKLAIRRGDHGEAVRQGEALVGTAGLPPSEAIQAEIVACEALVAAGRILDAERRLASFEGRLDPRAAPAAWGEFLRVRGTIHERSNRTASAHHDFAQSASVFELLGERYQAAVSSLALGRLAARAGNRTSAERFLNHAGAVFQTLGARRDLDEAGEIHAQLKQLSGVAPVVPSSDADDAVVRRLIEAAVLPGLLARETATALLETIGASAAVVFVAAPAGEFRLVASAGCNVDEARTIGQGVARGDRTHGDGIVLTEPLGNDYDGPRTCAVVVPRDASDGDSRRLRMLASIARQGFELCGLRDRPPQAVEPVGERPLDPLLPGFICASPAMNRVLEQIQRVQGHDLTVLITGESGTGKDLVARAIHAGSFRTSAVFLPYNCTTTTRDMADSQLFGHRRGSFTGAVADQAGVIRTAGDGTLFLDEVGDLPLDVQPKLLRFLEQGEVTPVGEARPQRVDVRILAATNADLEQRVAEGRFREDLYYRLSVIRIHVPPLRDRREEIPHLSTFFLREACERLNKPGVQLAPMTLDILARHWWPGNVRQLKNEIQRAVAMSSPGGIVEPDHLSSDLSTPAASAASIRAAGPPIGTASRNLAAAIEQVERELIVSTLDRTGGNISETARLLGLTRRGLYLKMRRLNLDGVGADTE